MSTRKLTVAQALVEFLAHQWSVDGNVRERTVPGILGIFGHGNVAGLGQALNQYNVSAPTLLPYYQARNEQAMVHQAVGFARIHRRRATLAATASVGPGAANMLTGAALATANRMPVLLLPSDTFATRVADPVLQALEHPHDTGIQVTDAYRPLSRFFDRVQRPEQLYSIALAAMRVLTDPADTGAVTIALPEDVQAEAIDVPTEFLIDREWHIRRPPPERRALEAATAAIQAAQTPFVIAGGGVIYSEAEDAMRRLVELTGIPVGTTQAGGGVLNWDHPQYLGGVGATGTAAANRLAAAADLVIGVGTRYSDFTTASRSAFQHPDVKFLNINVAAFDAYKHGTQLPVVADARETLQALAALLQGHRIGSEYAERIDRERRDWNAVVDAALTPTGSELPGQPEIIGAIQAASDPRDVLVQAAGSLPGDLHKLWRVRDTLGYHVEYAFSAMGYEIAGGIGVKRGLDALGDDRDVIVMVGDGSYLMLHSELATVVAEGIKIIVVLIQNEGFASIGHLSETVGAERFGTRYRYRNPDTLNFDSGELLTAVDLAANARSYGIDVIDVAPGADAIEQLSVAITTAKASSTATLIHIRSDPFLYAPDGESWWDVPIAQTSELASTGEAYTRYLQQRGRQRSLLG
jgi:3D-(3,5/4)-trihydroxycyclohexane-1,2-dione acylhydrolase (decyclizing)